MSGNRGSQISQTSFDQLTQLTNLTYHEKDKNNIGKKPY